VKTGLWLSTFLIPVVSIGALQVERGFVEKTIEVNSQDYRYTVFVPDSWSPVEEWPVILFLHGAGERGADNRAQTEVGLGGAIRRQEHRFPAIVVMPQCRRGVWWNDPAMEQLALKTLQSAIEEYNGDPDRVYLTGLSMGGYGTFYLGSKYPGKFAALVPVCGGIVPPFRARETNTVQGDPYLDAAKKIGSTPTWIFHGGADPVVPVSESRKMAEALKKVGNRVKYTEYEGVGHNSWDRAYSDPGLFGWMLSKRR
jgi:predicted peptidase